MENIKVISKGTRKAEIVETQRVEKTVKSTTKHLQMKKGAWYDKTGKNYGKLS